MQYSNDEADKSIRKRNFILEVFCLPILTAFAFYGFIILGSKSGYISDSGPISNFIFSIGLGFTLAYHCYKKWLKMPDGTFHNIKNYAIPINTKFAEPAAYDAEFKTSNFNKVLKIASGIILLCFPIYLNSKMEKLLIFNLILITTGIYMLYFGIKDMLNKNAELKIAKTGLWTQKLGFVHWDDINFAEVVEEEGNENTQTYLEIRLKNTKFEEANIPDERLLITNFKYMDIIENVINNSITKHNELKKSKQMNTTIL